MGALGVGHKDGRVPLSTEDEQLLVAVVAQASLEPIPEAVVEAATWIRRETVAGAVFVAGPEYAPAVAALGARRVLRAPTLVEPGDDKRRRRAERLLLEERDLGELAGRYGLTHVLVAPGDFAEEGIRWPSDLDGRRRFRLRYSGAGAFRVYEIVR